jgi:hypothetical protein
MAVPPISTTMADADTFALLGSSLNVHHASEGEGTAPSYRLAKYSSNPGRNS